MVQLSITCKYHSIRGAWEDVTDFDQFEETEDIEKAVTESVTEIIEAALYTSEEREILKLDIKIVYIYSSYNFDEKASKSLCILASFAT